MYNEVVISRLNNLKYLGIIKNSNINILSKKNDFGDVVKFYAQIDSSDIVKKISFKAKGCSAFIVACSYFCELIENKTITNALKVSDDKLDELLAFDHSRKHVYSIILNTFALMVKKYRKGIEKGVISPIDIENNDSENIKKVEKEEVEHKDIDKTEKSEINNEQSTLLEETNSNDELEKLNIQIEEIEVASIQNDVKQDKNKSKEGHISVLNNLFNIKNKNNSKPIESFDEKNHENNRGQYINTKEEFKKSNGEKINEKKQSFLNLLNRVKK